MPIFQFCLRKKKSPDLDCFLLFYGLIYLFQNHHVGFYLSFHLVSALSFSKISIS